MFQKYPENFAFQLFTGGKQKINSFENELQISKESKQLCRNLKNKPIKITKLGHKKWRLLN